MEQILWSIHYGKLKHYVFYDGVTLATWALVLATVLLIITGIATVLFAWRQIELQRRQSRVDNLERIVQWFDEENFRKLRGDLATKRLGKSGHLNTINPANRNDGDEVLDFFEHVGFLVKRDHLALYDVWHAFYSWIVIYYSDFINVIEDAQKRDPTRHEDFCWLHKKVSDVEKRQGAKAKQKLKRITRGPLVPAKEIEDQYSYDKSMADSKLPSPTPAPVLRKKHK